MVLDKLFLKLRSYIFVKGNNIYKNFYNFISQHRKPVFVN